MTDLTLYSFTAAEITLADAVGVLSDDIAWGLCYTPARCAFALREGGRLLDHKGRPLDPSQVFEARVFGPGGEMRWLRDPERQSGEGRAVYLSEASTGPQGWTSSQMDHLLALENHYLLWGQMLPPHPNGATPRPSWVVLGTARVGTLHVPFSGELTEGQGLRLVCREYLGPAPGDAGEQGHGNQVVRAERLCGIDPYGKPTTTDRREGNSEEHTS